jgi:hypothetical protein
MKGAAMQNMYHSTPRLARPQFSFLGRVFFLLLQTIDLIFRPSEGRMFYFVTGNHAVDPSLPLPVVLQRVKDVTKDYTYLADVIDYPQHPRTFLATRAGDCDDYANLFVNILSDFHPGVEAYLGSVTGFHTVCVVKDHKQYWHIGNWPGVHGPFDNLQELAQSFAREEDTEFVLRDRRFIVKEVLALRKEGQV